MRGQLYAFVHIDNCEARTRSLDAGKSVSWNQKMAFPSCGTKSVINVKVLSESTPPVEIASKVVCFSFLLSPAKCRRGLRRGDELPAAAARLRVRFRRFQRCPRCPCCKAA